MRDFMARILSRRSAWITALSVVTVLGCSRGGDPIEETIGRIAKGAEKRDASAVMEEIAGNFQTSDGSGRADAEAQLRRYFAAYETLDVKISDLTIERAPAAARATFRADMSGTARKIAGLEGLLPSASSWLFEVRLVPEGDRWKIAWVAYQPVEGR